MSTRPQFSRILHFVGMLAMSVTGTATIAQEARPPLQTKQQGEHEKVGGHAAFRSSLHL
jgi:hypothetical protein